MVGEVANLLIVGVTLSYTASLFLPYFFYLSELAC